MTNFIEIMDLAEIARRQMIVNYAEGMKTFKELQKIHGEDGMIYFKRAEAFEALG